MAEITTTQSFSDGDTVTATKLNNIQANASIQPDVITNKSSESNVDSANDFLLMYDSSAVALKKVTPSSIVRGGTGSNFSVGGNATVGGTLGVTGLITATGGVSGPVTGNVTGNVAGNVTGNLTGNVSGNVTGNVTGNVSGSSGSCTGNSATATALQTGRSIGITGDVSITSGTFNGTSDITATSTLASTGVTAGTYGSSSLIPQITVDAKGRITSATSTAVADVANGAITTLKIGDLQVTNAKIADATIEPAKLNSGGALFFSGAGNVGVGTNSPSTKLHVSGVITHTAGTIGSNANGTRTVTTTTTTPTGGADGDIVYVI
jgi:hypothetical protein